MKNRKFELKYGNLNIKFILIILLCLVCYKNVIGGETSILNANMTVENARVIVKDAFDAFNRNEYEKAITLLEKSVIFFYLINYRKHK